METVKKKKFFTSPRWIEVRPHGLVGGMIPKTCLMVFKEKKGTRRFAVALSHLQGQISLEQSLHREEPFKFLNELFHCMGVKVEKCYFEENKGHFIVVRLILKGDITLRSMVFKAEDVVPFAVYSGCRFFCEKDFFTDMLEQKTGPHFKKDSIRKPLYMN